MSRPSEAEWTWSPGVVLSIASRASFLAKAKHRQAALVQAWLREGQEMLLRMEATLAEAAVPDEEMRAEQVRATAPLGQLLHPHTGLGQRRRSPRTSGSIEEQHEQLHRRLVAAGDCTNLSTAATTEHQRDRR